jgi:hypothetical protein
MFVMQRRAWVILSRGVKAGDGGAAPRSAIALHARTRLVSASGVVRPSDRNRHIPETRQPQSEPDGGPVLGRCCRPPTRIRSNAAIVERDGRRLSLFGRASAPQRRIATSDRLPGSPACLKWPHAQTAARAWHLGLVPTGEAASPPPCSDSQMRSGPQPRKTGRSARRMRTTRCLCRQASCSGKDRIPPGRPPGGRRRACRKLDKS